MNRGLNSINQTFTLRDPIDREAAHKKRGPPTPMPDDKVKDGWQGQDRDALVAKLDWYPDDVRYTPRAYLQPIPATYVRNREIKSASYLAFAARSTKRSHDSVSTDEPLSSTSNVLSMAQPASHSPPSMGGSAANTLSDSRTMPSTSQPAPQDPSPAGGSALFPHLVRLPEHDVMFGAPLSILFDFGQMKSFHKFEKANLDQEIPGTKQSASLTGSSALFPPLTHLPIHDSALGAPLSIWFDFSEMESTHTFELDILKKDIPGTRPSAGMTGDELLEVSKSVPSKHADTHNTPRNKRPRFEVTQSLATATPHDKRVTQAASATPRQNTDAMELDETLPPTHQGTTDQSMSGQETSVVSDTILETPTLETPTSTTLAVDTSTVGTPAETTSVSATGYMSMAQLKRVKPVVPDSDSDSDGE